MGAGASSLDRLRKSVIIKAYHKRQSGETIDTQFRPLAIRKKGRLLINLYTVSSYLNLEENILCSLIGIDKRMNVSTLKQLISAAIFETL